MAAHLGPAVEGRDGGELGLGVHAVGVRRVVLVHGAVADGALDENGAGDLGHSRADDGISWRQCQRPGIISISRAYQ